MKIFTKDLSAFYGKNQVLKNLNIELNQGEFVCLCGKNGAGKSTLLKALCGQTEKSREMSFVFVEENNGKKLLPEKPAERARLVSFMEQSETAGWDIDVFSYILNGRFSWCGGNYGKADEEKVCIAAEKLDISELLERSVYSLSGGEFQKVRIARALCQDAAFMLLDEPAANLDFIFEEELLAFLKKYSREENRGILISIHNVNNALRFADRIFMLTESREIICGKDSEIAVPEVMEKSFGKGVEIFTHPVYGCFQVCGGKKLSD